MFRIVLGDIFKSNCDCIAIPVKSDLVLEGNLGGQASLLLGKQAEIDISLLKNINYGEATLIYSHGKIPAKAIILVANTWKSSLKDNHEAAKKTEKFLIKSFQSCFELAIKSGFKSIAVPALSTGKYGLPFTKCFDCLLSAYKYSNNKDYSSLIDLDFYVVKESSIDYCKRIVGDECDEFVVTNEKPEEKMLLAEGRKNLTKDWYSKNEYGEVLETENKFTQVFARAITNSKMQKKDVHNRVIGKSQFSDYLTGKISPNRKTVIAMCMNMSLEINEINEVLATLETKLDPNNKFDKVILNCILSETRDCDDINEELEKAGLKPIFKKSKDSTL